MRWDWAVPLTNTVIVHLHRWRALCYTHDIYPVVLEAFFAARFLRVAFFPAALALVFLAPVFFCAAQRSRCASAMRFLPSSDMYPRFFTGLPGPRLPGGRPGPRL